MTTNSEKRLDKLAYAIFATLYAEYGYGESGAWNEAYRRAGELLSKQS